MNLSNYKPLARATYENNIQEVKDLLDKGADPNEIEAEDGRTPLIIACEGGCEKIVELLLDDPHIDVNYQNPKEYIKTKETPLKIAVHFFCPQILEKILNHSQIHVDDSALASLFYNAVSLSDLTRPGKEARINLDRIASRTEVSLAKTMQLLLQKRIIGINDVNFNNGSKIASFLKRPECREIIFSFKNFNVNLASISSVTGAGNSLLSESLRGDKPLDLTRAILEHPRFNGEETNLKVVFERSYEILLSDVGHLWKAKKDDDSLVEIDSERSLSSSLNKLKLILSKNLTLPESFHMCIFTQYSPENLQHQAWLEEFSEDLLKSLPQIVETYWWMTGALHYPEKVMKRLNYEKMAPFNLALFLCDEFYQLNASLRDLNTLGYPQELKAMRFLKIIQKLPMELQQTLSNRAYGSAKNHYIGPETETTLKILVSYEADLAEDFALGVIQNENFTIEAQKRRRVKDIMEVARKELALPFILNR